MHSLLKWLKSFYHVMYLLLLCKIYWAFYSYWYLYIDSIWCYVQAVWSFQQFIATSRSLRVNWYTLLLAYWLTVACRDMCHVAGVLADWLRRAGHWLEEQDTSLWYWRSKVGLVLCGKVEFYLAQVKVLHAVVVTEVIGWLHSRTSCQLSPP